MALRIVECPSPNHDERPGPVDILVMHYTGMKTAEEAIARLTDPAAKVSAHYTLDRDGRIFRHVAEDRRAWHAGVSWWAGERNVNARSIGIEIVNPGHEFGYVPFTDEQIAALIDLSRGILSRHPIPPHRVVGHSDVAPARKEDPGELFPWKHLADFGIGVWPVLPAPPYAPSEHSDEARGTVLEPRLAAALARFGYGIPPDMDVPMAKVITAFQRRFRTSRIDGIADAECIRLAEALCESVPVA